MKTLLLAIVIPFGTFVPWTNPIPDSYYTSKEQALESAYDAGTKTAEQASDGVKAYCDSIDWSKYNF